MGSKDDDNDRKNVSVADSHLRRFSAVRVAEALQEVPPVIHTYPHPNQCNYSPSTQRLRPRPAHELEPVRVERQLGLRAPSYVAHERRLPESRSCPTVV